MGPIAPAAFDLVVAGGNGCFSVRLVGELDAFSVPRLRAELRRLIDEGAYDVTIDLRTLEFMDLSGMRALLHGLRCLRSCGGDMALASATRSSRKLLQITGALGVFPLRGYVPDQNCVVASVDGEKASNKEIGDRPGPNSDGADSGLPRQRSSLQRRRSPSEISFAVNCLLPGESS